MSDSKEDYKGIKEATWEHHKNAERQEFVKVLMSGEIPKDLYATYLYNQQKMYTTLEYHARVNGLFEHLPGVERNEAIYKDFVELWDKEEKPILTESTLAYCNHIENIKDDPEKLMAHIYVRHMGDLSGGQMISKKVPGAGMMYRFRNPNECKRTIREQIKRYYDSYQSNIVMEARLCFDYATKLFGELYELSMAKTD